uniref:thiol oxidase n=1 Tax=viral metagenome TaxID=1070528 RepID=A0A6C0KZR4_9ZZZZ
MTAPDTPIHMPPQIWGPIFWSTLHIASLTYSDKPTDRQKANMKAFYESMVDVLPCPICRVHYEANLEEMPIDKALDSRMSLIHWVWTMHNRVNVQLGKREFTFGEFVQSMRDLEKAKKAVPPSFTTSNTIATQIHDFSFVDGLLLGTGSALVLGAGLYYMCTEGVKKSK